MTNQSPYAMRIAALLHKNQRRKYTNEPYFTHLAQVTGMVASVFAGHAICDNAMCVAWLHDSMEDQGMTVERLKAYGFNDSVILGIVALSDVEQGNRATRKRLSRERIWAAPSWVQTIKVADLISNFAGIAEHDPQFAKVFMEEALLFLEGVDDKTNLVEHLLHDFERF